MAEERMLITGGQRLEGTVRVSGGKNTSVAILAAALLFGGGVRLGLALRGGRGLGRGLLLGGLSGGFLFLLQPGKRHAQTAEFKAWHCGRTRCGRIGCG